MDLSAGLTKDQASALISGWREYPATFFEKELGVTRIWRLQDQMLAILPHAIRSKKHIYVGSGHSLGKDWVCGGIGIWFLYCFCPSIVTLTGPTDRQVKDIMWKETQVHWNNRVHDLGGKAYKDPRIEIRPDWFLSGFATKDTGASAKAGGGKFQGIRAPNMCIIVTEAQAVEDTIYDQIDAVATTENCLVIFIGNPTRASGRFAKGLRDRKNNIVFNFSCLENPNYIHKRTVIPGLADYNWVVNKLKKWPEGDPRRAGRLLGQLPTTSINSVFPNNLIENGKKKVTPSGAKHNAGVSMDIAGEGDDDNVRMIGAQGMVEKTEAYNIGTPAKNALDCVKACAEINGIFIIIDCDGLGIGTWQELNDMPDISDKYHILKFHGSTPLKIDKFRKQEGHQNIRSLAAWTARNRLEQGLAQIPPDDEELIEELEEIKYFENKRGLIQIEDNDDIKERLRRSPDRAMAWIMLQYAYSLDLEPLYQEDTKGYFGSNDYGPDTGPEINPARA